MHSGGAGNVRRDDRSEGEVNQFPLDICLSVCLETNRLSSHRQLVSFHNGDMLDVYFTFLYSILRAAVYAALLSNQSVFSSGTAHMAATADV